MKSLQRFSIAILLALVTACASPAMPSLAESIAAGYITVETLAETALAAHEGGVITDGDRALARLALQQAKNLLDTASSLSATGKPVEAAEKTTEALSYFDTVRKLLEASP